MKAQNQHKCVRCGSLYLLNDQEREAYAAPDQFDDAGKDHCLACWLGVGSLDVEKTDGSSTSRDTPPEAA